MSSLLARRCFWQLLARILTYDMPCFFIQDSKGKISVPSHFQILRRRATTFAMSRTIEEACEQLEGSRQIQWKQINIKTHVDDGDGEVVVIYFQDINYFLSCYSDRLFHVDAWTRFGRAVRNSSTLDELRLFVDEEGMDHLNGDLLETAAPCISAFMAEVKHNTTIETAFLNFTVLPMNDLGDFIINNKALNHLWLGSQEAVSLEQSTILSRAISSSHLGSIGIMRCCFGLDGAFARMLEGCSKLNQLQVRCKHNSECTAVAAFLEHPANMLKTLCMELDGDFKSFDCTQAMKEISESLVRNEHLKRLIVERQYGNVCLDSDKLLCDISSIQSISESNHSLEDIWAGSGHSNLTQQCLQINKNVDKAAVKRKKILRFYFVGQFDVSPFSSMTLSILPEVMTKIEEENKHSAIYRLLQCIPQLCNVSDRASCEQNDRKRHKMSS
jgi:hypothetical protein